MSQLNSSILQSRTWKEVVADALTQLGGEGHLNDITQIVQQDPKAATNKHVAEKVRQVVRSGTLFAPVNDGSGLYRLVLSTPTFPSSISLPPLPHVTDEIQGMLLTIGKLYGYSVFAPANDRTMRTFNGQPLSVITDIKPDLSEIVGQQKAAVVQQIDVLWFDEDEIDYYPAVGFEVENTTKVDTGLNRLAEIPRRFNTGLFIIGNDDKDRNRFNSLLTRNVYKPFQGRMQFATFDDVRHLYSVASAFHQARLDNDFVSAAFGVEKAHG